MSRMIPRPTKVQLELLGHLREGAITISRARQTGQMSGLRAVNHLGWAHLNGVYYTISASGVRMLDEAKG